MSAPAWHNTAGHLRGTLDLRKLRAALTQAKRSLAGVEFEALAVTGLSGVMFGSALALRLGKPLLIVRKEESPCPHSWRSVEGPDEVRSFVFVDDLIDSGSTLIRVLTELRGCQRYAGAVCVGVYCYHREADADDFLHIEGAGVAIRWAGKAKEGKRCLRPCKARRVEA